MLNKVSAHRAAEYLVKSCVEKGWTDTYASFNTTYAQEKGWENGSLTFRPRLEVDGDKTDFEETFYLYEDDSNGDYLVTYLDEKLARVPTVKQFRMKKLLEGAAELTDLAKTLGMSESFINPITALSDQLRLNILEDQRPVPSADPFFNLPQDDEVPF